MQALGKHVWIRRHPGAVLKWALTAVSSQGGVHMESRVALEAGVVA
jgi:hypothetical protein